MSSYMEFDLEWGGCVPAADVILAWELGNECQSDDVIACAVPKNWYNHGTWWELRRVHIYFDHDWYYNLGYWQDAWQLAVSAHEWGHVMNLVTEYRDQCLVPTRIMGLANLSAAPCVTGPTPPEVSAVFANYGLFDSDGDDFQDAVEWYLDTDAYDDCPNVVGSHDAWPLDMDMNRLINLGGDVARYTGKIGCVVATNPECRRLDLNADGVINLGGDISKYVGRIGETCT
jgi:hypothetical protein